MCVYVMFDVYIYIYIYIALYEEFARLARD